MKLHQEDRNFESTVELKSTAFKINASPQAFKILSDSLYQKKELAVLRELTANAYDAHVDAGNTKTPFRVHLPTPIEPYFEVEDYGTGLSDNEIHSLYTTYFGSNKNESNDFIGGLGLGSKSPFAYTDQFSVESRFEGFVRKYQIYIGADAVPMVTIMSKQKTDRENGLTINVPIGEKGFSGFKDAAKMIFPHIPIPIKHNLIGEINTDKTTYIEKYDIKLNTGAKCVVKVLAAGDRNAYSPENKFTVLMGIIPYPVSGLTSMHRPAAALSRLSINVEVPIGLLDIAASREALSYNEQTLQALDEIALRIAQNFTKNIKTKLRDSKNIIEYIMLREKITKEYSGFFIILKNHKVSIQEKYPNVYQDIADSLKGDDKTANILWQNRIISLDIPHECIIKIIKYEQTGYRYGAAPKITSSEFTPGSSLHYSQIVRLVRDLGNTETPNIYWAEKRKPFKTYFEENTNRAPALVIFSSKKDASTVVEQLGLTFKNNIQALPIRKGSSKTITGGKRYTTSVYTNSLQNSAHWKRMSLAGIVDAVNNIDGNMKRIVIFSNGSTNRPNLTTIVRQTHIKATDLAKKDIFVIGISAAHTKKRDALIKLGAYMWTNEKNLPPAIFETAYGDAIEYAAFKKAEAVNHFLALIKIIFREDSAKPYTTTTLAINLKSLLGDKYKVRLPKECNLAYSMFRRITPIITHKHYMPTPEFTNTHKEKTRQIEIQLNKRFAVYNDLLMKVINDYPQYILAVYIANLEGRSFTPPNEIKDTIQQLLLIPEKEKKNDTD